MNESLDSFVNEEAPSHTWERRTHRIEDDQLLTRTWNWINALPKGVRPVHLPAEFPRNANDLSRLWPETAAWMLTLRTKNAVRARTVAASRRSSGKSCWQCMSIRFEVERCRSKGAYGNHRF